MRTILFFIGCVFVGCDSRVPEPELGKAAAAVESTKDILPGLDVLDLRIARAFDGSTEVRVVLFNSTLEPIAYSRLSDADVSLQRPGGLALLRANSPGKAKPLVIPARSTARVSFLFDASAIDATSFSLFGRKLTPVKS